MQLLRMWCRAGGGPTTTHQPASVPSGHAVPHDATGTTNECEPNSGQNCPGGGEGEATRMPPAAVGAVAGALGPRPELGGRWRKDRARSDSMDPMCEVRREPLLL